MGVNPHEVTVTREDVYEWLKDYDGQIRDTKKLREYITGKLKDNEIDPQMSINTTGMDSLGDRTSLVEMIILDIESYADVVTAS